ncbi:MAG: hypothetical protein R2795_13810 [Saprospiraceae bacterium]
MDNGESIIITRYFHVPVCYNGKSTGFPNFQSTYLANFGRGASRCQNPTPGDFGQYNYDNSNVGDPRATLAQVSVIRQATPCQTALVRYRHTAGHVGNIAYGQSFNIRDLIEPYGLGWPVGGYRVASITLVSNNAPLAYSPNGGPGTVTIDLRSDPSLLNTDPGGAGVGLEDLDGDGYYDDMDSGQTFDFIVEWEYQAPVPCAQNPNEHNLRLRGYVDNLCGETMTAGTFNIVSGRMHATGLLLFTASPTELSLGQIGTMQAQVSRTSPNLTYLSCPTNEWQIRFPLAPGMNVDAIRAGATNLAFTIESDTVVAVFSNSTPNPFLCDIDFTVTPGVTPSGTSPVMILAYTCNNSCANSRQDASCLVGPPILVPSPGPCTDGGGITNNSKIERITTGYTDYTGTTRVDLSSLTAISKKRGLPCDSVLVTSTSGVQAGLVITGGEPLYYEVSYALHGGSNRLYDWLGGTFTYQGTTASLPAPAYEADFNGNHVATYYLGNFPTGAVVDIALYGLVQNAVSLTGTLEGVSNFGNYFFNLDDGFSNPSPDGGDTRYSCNGQALEFYVRNPKGNFDNVVYSAGGSCNAWTYVGRYWYLRGTNGSGPQIDYFPGEVRPIDKLDSIVVILSSPYTYVPGFDQIRVGGNPNDGGFPAGQFITQNIPPATVQGNRLVWYNTGDWYIPDDALNGGYRIFFGIASDCNVPVAPVGLVLESVLAAYDTMAIPT